MPFQAKNRREAIKTAKNAKNDPDLAMALALSRSMVEDEAEKRASREEKLLELGLDDIVEEDRKVQPLLLPLQSASGMDFFSFFRIDILNQALCIYWIYLKISVRFTKLYKLLIHSY